MADHLSGGYIAWEDVKIVTTPRNGTYQVYVDYWWAINEMGEVAIYSRRGRAITPQCNKSREVIEQIASTTCAPQYAGVIQLPVAYFPWRG